ncbi:MAG TPA: T9SS type A sorting domain-containing protein [Flavisolibacter sp.]
MKHVYTFYSRTLMLIAFITCVGSANAQIQGVTTVSNSGDCSNVTANFNTNDQGFNSPSIYYGNSSFYFNTSQGWWSEVDGVSAVPPVPGGGGMRLVSIISPLYPNPNPVGIFDVGFYYVVPNPAVNRFQVRIISATPQGEFTVYNVEATSNFRTFTEFSTPPTPYAGGAPQIAGMQGNICIRLIDQDITNAPGVAYRVEVTYEIAESAFTVFDDLSIGGTEAAPLPVNFLGVSANKIENGGVQVKWDVADEVDVREYHLEKSTNGLSFTKVGAVPAVGGTTVYDFVDNSSKAPQVFYRVKSVDIDGTVKYSGIIRFKDNTSFTSDVKVYPSPARSQITVQHDRLDSRSRISISTMDGRIIKMITPGQGISNTMMDVSNLSSGVYVIKVVDGNGKIETTTFVKQ